MEAGTLRARRRPDGSQGTKLKHEVGAEMDFDCDHRAVLANMSIEMNGVSLATYPVTEPLAIGIGVVALILLYLGFKAAKFVMKMLLILVALVIIGLAVCWYYAVRHGGPQGTKTGNSMAQNF